MLEPLTALGLAANLLQFIELGIKVTSKTRDIHNSATGALVENLDLEILTDDLSTVARRLRFGRGIIAE